MRRGLNCALLLLLVLLEDRGEMGDKSRALLPPPPPPPPLTTTPLETRELFAMLERWIAIVIQHNSFQRGITSDSVADADYEVISRRRYYFGDGW